MSLLKKNFVTLYNTAGRKFNQKMIKITEKLEQNILNDLKDKTGAVYGPVPSRRLGYSLGINNIKRKICTYDCIYCQAGKTTGYSTENDCCLSPHELFFLVKDKVEKIKSENIKNDYISFVPNGEPTIDKNLGKEILLLREFGYKIAVFTNSSLLWNDNVKENLLNADYVSVKVDSVKEEIWESINRPHCRLKFDSILQGIIDFSKTFRGELTTETMIINSMNDKVEDIAEIGKYLNSFSKSKAYFTIPIRPTNESFNQIPNKEDLLKIGEFAKNNIDNAIMLCCPETGDFNIFTNQEADLTAIMSVHPINEDAMSELLKRKHLNNSIILFMIDKGLIKSSEFNGKKFYSRKD